MNKKMVVVTLTAFMLTSLAMEASWAGCKKVKDGKESEFTGDSLEGVSVDKKAMQTLNKKFPALNVTEGVFTGVVQSCSSCTDNYVTCTE